MIKQIERENKAEEKKRYKWNKSPEKETTKFPDTQESCKVHLNLISNSNLKLKDSQ